MIQVEELSFGFTAKDLYKDISFTLEAGAALCAYRQQRNRQIHAGGDFDPSGGVPL